MTETRRPVSTNGGHRSRCLLVVPRGHDVPLDLLDGLTRRRVDVREVHDAPAAMVALAETGPSRPKVVVVVHPAAQSAAEVLVRAIGRYHGDVTVWRYDFAADPPLQPWPVDSANTPRREPQPDADVPTDDEPAAAPTAPAEADPPSDAERLALDEDDDSPLLSDEELAMLLGDDEPNPEKD